MQEQRRVQERQEDEEVLQQNKDRCRIAGMVDPTSVIDLEPTLQEPTRVQAASSSHTLANALTATSAVRVDRPPRLSPYNKENVLLLLDPPVEQPL